MLEKYELSMRTILIFGGLSTIAIIILIIWIAKLYKKKRNKEHLKF